MLLRYAFECAQSWYAHINHSLIRGVPNGALYLITGCDKACTWGVVSFITNADRGTVSLDFVPKVHNEMGRPPKYWFRKHNFASASSDADDFGNQSGCVFLRGFKIAVRRLDFLLPQVIVQYAVRIGVSSHIGLEKKFNDHLFLPQRLDIPEIT